MQPGKYHIIVGICVYLSINSHRKYSEDNLSHMWKYHIVISPLRVFLIMAVIIVNVFSVCRRMLSVWVAQGQAMMGPLYLNYVSHDTVIQFVSLVTQSTKCVKVGSCRFALIHSSSSMTDHAMCRPFYAREKLMGQPTRGALKSSLTEE